MNLKSNLSFFAPEAQIVGIPVPGVTIDERIHDVMQFTSHPTQKGAAVTDHAYKEPVQIHINCAWDDPGMLRQAFTDAKTRQEIYDLLRSLQKSAKLFDYLSTLGEVYHNMQIKALTKTTDAQTYSILAVNIVLQQVIIVNTASAAMPADKQKKPGQTATPSDTGKQAPKPVSTATPAGSALSAIAGAINKVWVMLGKRHPSGANSGE